MRSPGQRRGYPRRHAGRLDRALAAGADPRTTAALSARARALCERRTREVLASAIYDALRQASRRRAAIGSLVARRAVQRNRAELLELAAALRQAPDVAARGVAAVNLLVTEGGGPLYNEDESGELEQTITSARAWLCPG